MRLKLSRKMRIYKSQGANCDKCSKRIIGYIQNIKVGYAGYNDSDNKLCLKCLNESFKIIDSNKDIRGYYCCIMCWDELSGTRQVYENPNKEGCYAHMKCYKKFLEKLEKFKEEYKLIRVSESI